MVEHTAERLVGACKTRRWNLGSHCRAGFPLAGDRSDCVGVYFRSRFSFRKKKETEYSVKVLVHSRMAHPFYVSS